jgi:predicted transglutaminase-like cysteine proteinase
MRLPRLTLTPAVLTLSTVLLTGCNQTVPVQQQIRSNLSTFAPLGVTTFQGEAPDLSQLPTLNPDSISRRVLEDVHHEVVQRFRYRDEETESWEGGFEGDCDDFAITAQQVLAELGIRSELVFAMVPMPDGSRGGHLFTMVGEYALDNRFTSLQRITDLPYDLVSYGNLGDREWRKFITATRYLSQEEHAKQLAYVPPKATPVRQAPRQVIDLASISSAMGHDRMATEPPVRTLTPFKAEPASPAPAPVMTPKTEPPAPTEPELSPQPKSSVQVADTTPAEPPSFFSLMRQPAR